MAASGPGWRNDAQLPGREDGAHQDGRGASQTALDLTTAHCGERKAFGGHLSDLGAIRQRLAMRQAEVDAVRASMYHAAWMGDSGQDNVRAMSGLKAFGAEVANRVMYDCLQFHGGMG